MLLLTVAALTVSAFQLQRSYARQVTSGGEGNAGQANAERYEILDTFLEYFR